jgi:oligosaccharide repeat unit polymerase
MNPSRRLLLAIGAAIAVALGCALLAPARPVLFASAVVGGAAIAAIVTTTSRSCAAGLDLFSPIVAFPLLYVIWFGIASVPLIRDLDPPRAPTPIATQWPIYALGLAAWMAGAWGAGRALAPVSISGEQRPADRFDSTRLFAACATVFAVAASTTGAIFARRGVPLLAGRGEAARLAFVSSGWERLLFCGFATVAILVFAHAARERFRIQLRFWVLLLLSLGGLATTGDRGLVALPIACGVVLAHYLWRPLRPAHVATILAPLALFAAAVVIVRGTGTYGSQYVDELQRISGLPRGAVPLVSIYQGVWAGPNVFARLQDVVPSQVGYGHGAYAVAPLVSFLPGEQTWAADAIKRTLDDRYVGMGEPATLLGGFYLDFGLAGIVVGMALAGFAMTALYRRMRARGDAFTTILYAHASFLAFLSLYGDLYNGNPLFLWNGAITWVVWRFAARRDSPSG